MERGKTIGKVANRISSMHLLGTITETLVKAMKSLGTGHIMFHSHPQGDFNTTLIILILFILFVLVLSSLLEELMELLNQMKLFLRAVIPEVVGF
jgi:hypothetical protein